ncbi:MAG TPA: hypothetical protein VHA11_13005, partial [Bryobacteraceae bacterium]|nr:hypothetical protein [Bryobacteraceae bacterium]
MRIRAALLIAAFGMTAGARGAGTWSWSSHGYVLSWDVQHDAARLASASAAEVWHGPLLPGFWLQMPGGERRFVKAELNPSSPPPAAAGGTLALILPGAGRGELDFSPEPWGIRFRELRVTWNRTAPALIGLYFGAAPLSEEQASIVPSLEVPFWPAWSAEGYSVPSGKGAPVQSFFRNWDMGHATFPLGSFGPSLGTPYAAAFPRPVLSAAMGGANGWLAIGPGSIPDGALTFEVRAGTAMLHSLYREDLWGGPGERVRVWHEPLRLAWAPEAWDAFHELFGSFGPARPALPLHQKSHWNTWGNFKNQDYDLRFQADHVAQFGAEVLVIDDGWESFTGSGTPNRQRYPAFDADLRYIRDKGLALGFW